MDVQQTSFPLYPVAVILGFLATSVLLLGIPPLFWHIRNHNAAAGSLVAWVLLDNLITTLDIIIWPTDDIQHWYNGVGLCDIEVKITFTGVEGGVSRHWSLCTVNKCGYRRGTVRYIGCIVREECIKI